MKISVGLPVYDGKLQQQSVACLLAETSIAHMMGDELNVRFLPACTNLALGRNQLVRQFLDSGDDKLVFLDADVTFELGSLVRLAHYPVDMVGGAYRLKQDDERYPVHLLREPKELGPGGLVEVAMVPTGFLALSRKVFSDFEAAYPGRTYNIDGHKFYCYFQIPFQDGHFYTEDAYFCKEYRAIGGQVYLDPEIHLTHWQFNTPYPGHIGDFMRKRSGMRPTQKPEVA